MGFSQVRGSDYHFGSMPTRPKSLLALLHHSTMLLSVETIVDTVLSEKTDDWEAKNDLRNPVIESSEFAYRVRPIYVVQIICV